MPLGTTVFYKGLNQDSGFDKLPEGTYYDARNMRIVTREGGSTGNLENIKGNLYKIQYPDVGEVLRVTVANRIEDKNFTWEVQIDGDIVSFNTKMNYQDMADAINANAKLNSYSLRAYVQTSDTLYAQDALSITAEDGSRLAGRLGFRSTDVSHFFVDFPTGNVQSAVGTFLGPSSYIRAASGVYTIGWVNMRDDIILWSTDSRDEIPNQTTGQLWRLSYDKKTLTCTLTLLYHNYLNLSTKHPIAKPGMVVARYETPDIQRVYWTDNYNVPRSCNVADPDLFTKAPTLLETNSIVSPYLPIPQRINQGGGSLKTGVHQIAYRLNNSDGGQTAWFLPSYPIVVVEKPEGSRRIYETQFLGTPGSGSAKFTYINSGYDGAPDNLSPGNTVDWPQPITGGTTTGKTITYNIGIVDDNYDTIEIAHIYRTTLDQVPDINIIAEEPVSGSSFDYTLTGDENKIPITLEEFIARNQAFERVGTMNSKDDYLFYGDVTLKTLDVDYDTRAYRFNTDYALLGSSSGQQNHLIDGPNPQWDLVPEDHDCINLDDSPIPNATGSNYLYQSDGSTLGGEGPNIKYRFITEDFELDHYDFNGASPVGAPYRHASENATVNYSINSSTPHNQIHSSTNTFRDFHSPMLSGFLRNYMRDEVYRFAVVFYDQQGNPGYASWIGDIRMPHTFMPNTPGATNPYDRSLQFATCDASSWPVMGKSLGIEFTLSNLDTLPEEVAGYSIVRVKRDFDNRSIIGQGLWHPAIFDTTQPTDIHRLVHSQSRTFDASAGTNWGILASESRPSTNVSAFYSFDFLNWKTSLPTAFQDGDQIDVVGQLYNATTSAVTMNPNGGSTDCYVMKNYGFQSTTSPITDSTLSTDYLTPYNVSANRIVYSWDTDGGDHTLQGYLYVNHTRLADVGTGGSSWGTEGVKCYVITHEGTQIQGDDDNTSTLYGWGTLAHGANSYAIADGFASGVTAPASGANQDDIYVANYKRSFQSGITNSQYGSNTYQGRSTSEYICTNHYQKIEKGVTSYTNKVFGGDTFICIHDIWRDLRDEGTGGGSATQATLKLYPVESYYNIEMRQPITAFDENAGPWIPNKHFLDNDVNDSPEEESYAQSIFSVENDIARFFPKPVPFVETDEYDTRIYNNSNPKINGELYDQWRVFKSADYIQADTEYGRVTSLVNQNDELYFLQERALGIYQVNKQAIVPDADGTSIILGSGGVGERLDYVSTRMGSWHKFGIAQGPSGFAFFDLFSKKLVRVGPQLGAISDIKGLSGYLDRYVVGDLLVRDNPIDGDFITDYPAGITSTYDYRYNEYLFTFHDSEPPTYQQQEVQLVCEGSFDNVVQNVSATELVKDTTGAIYTGSTLGTPNVDYFDIHDPVGAGTNAYQLAGGFYVDNTWITHGVEAGLHWTYGVGRAEINLASLGPTYGDVIEYSGNVTDFQVGREYRIVFDLTVDQGEIAQILFAGNVLETNVSASITTAKEYYSVITQPNPEDATFIVETNYSTPGFPGDGFRGTLDNVSIREVTYDLGLGSCWTADPVTAWTFKGNQATKTDTVAATLTQTISAGLNPTSSYIVYFRIKNSNNQGSVYLTLGGNATANVTSNGVYSFQIDPTYINDDLVINCSADWLGSIDSIEMYEYLQIDPGYYEHWTIAYNELIDAFTGFYDLTPPMWINNKRNIITPYHTTTDLFYFWDEGLYGRFNGTVFPCWITYIINEGAAMEKIFDNLVLNAKLYDLYAVSKEDIPFLTELNNVPFDLMRVRNHYQDTGFKALDNTRSRKIKRKWNIAIGGDQGNTTRTERIKSNYAFVTLQYNNLVTQDPDGNDTNYRLIVESVLNKYRVNPTNPMEYPKSLGGRRNRTDDEEEDIL